MCQTRCRVVSKTTQSQYGQSTNADIAGDICNLCTPLRILTFFGRRKMKPLRPLMCLICTRRVFNCFFRQIVPPFHWRDPQALALCCASRRRRSINIAPRKREHLVVRWVLAPVRAKRRKDRNKSANPGVGAQKITVRLLLRKIHPYRLFRLCQPKTLIPSSHRCRRLPKFFQTPLLCTRRSKLQP